MGHRGGTRCACAATMPRSTPPPRAGAGGGVTHATNLPVNGTVKLVNLKPCLKMEYPHRQYREVRHTHPTHDTADLASHSEYRRYGSARGSNDYRG